MDREAADERSRKLAQALIELAGRIEDRPERLSLQRAAQGEIDELVRLGARGARQLEALLMAIRVRALWTRIQTSLWRAYYAMYGLESAPVHQASMLRRVCEGAENRDVRLWALQAMPATLREAIPLWEIALPVLAALRHDSDSWIAEAANEALRPIVAAEAPWARELLVASIRSSPDREVLLFAIPVTERLDGADDVRQAIDALFHCYENGLDTVVRAAIERTLRVHRGDHPIEFLAAEEDYARRAKTWVDRQVLEQIGGRAADG